VVLKKYAYPETFFLSPSSILGIAIDCGAGPASTGYIGFRYWVSPGPFAQFTAGDLVIPGAWGRFLAFWNVFVQAAFSYLGTEILATTIGEAENPRKNVPKAIKRVFYRILMCKSSFSFPSLHLSFPLRLPLIFRFIALFLVRSLIPCHLYVQSMSLPSLSSVWSFVTTTIGS
jgi:amino acid transporter